MKIQNRINKGAIGGFDLPKLHGRTKITLTDVRTGERQIIEKDNLVTDEVANIYANNLFGAMDYSKVMPLRDMFGGVLVFDDTQDTSLLFPPDEDTNGLVANCGMDSHTSASTTRGNFNGALSEMISSDTGYKFVFDFSTNQGNGTWKSISLCNKLGGSVGTKPIEAITDASLIGVCSNRTKALATGVAIPFSTYYYALVKVNLTTGTGIQAVLDGSDLTLNEVSLCTSKVGINNTCDRTIDETVGEAIVTDTHSITLSRSYDKQYAAICCDASYLYVIEPNSNGGTSLYIDKVSLSDWSVTTTTITDANMSLAKIQATRYVNHSYSVRVCISAGYLYWQKSNKRTFYKINLSNAADISELTSTLTADIDEDFGQVEFGENFVVGANYFINGDTVYPMTKEDISRMHTGSFPDFTKPIVRIIKDGSQMYGWGYIWDDLYNNTIFAFVPFPRLYLGTIQNLNSAVVKDNTKTAQIEYSITIATP